MNDYRTDSSTETTATPAPGEMSPARGILQNAHLRKIEESYETCVPYLHIRPSLDEAFDPTVVGFDARTILLRSENQAKHEVNTRHSGLAYWSQGRKNSIHASTGHAKFESCAPIFEPDDRAGRLQKTQSESDQLGLTSRMAACHLRQIIDNYIASSKETGSRQVYLGHPATS